jgi:hypothetical protein
LDQVNFRTLFWLVATEPTALIFIEMTSLLSMTGPACAGIEDSAIAPNASAGMIVFAFIYLLVGKKKLVGCRGRFARQAHLFAAFWSAKLKRKALMSRW